MKKYVLGFAFDRKKQVLVLIEKQKPDWQKGKHNGVGGKIDPEDNTPLSAMVREFKEETGVSTEEDMWKHFATMIFKDDILGGEAQVYCFKMFSNVIYQCRTIESEKIKQFHLLPEIFEVSGFESLQGKPIISNLDVIIPMALNDNFIYCELNLR